MKFLKFIIIWSFLNSFSQSQRIFKIETILVNEAKLKTKNDFERFSPNFYEDEKFVVRQTCFGEFGGAIYFKDKKTKVEYFCTATCAVAVNKINNKYIVTTTLAHMDGNSGIIEIEEPKFMAKVIAKKNDKTKVQYVGDQESNSSIGTKDLFGAFRLEIVASFEFREKLYHITTDYKKTYLSEIIENKIVNLDLILENSIWSYEPNQFRTKDNHIIVFFKNQITNGYLDIYKNQIKIYKSAHKK